MTGGSAARPPFLEALSEAHYAQLCRCVVLTGNIHDLFAIEESGAVRFASVTRILESALAQARYPRRGGTERFVVLAVRGGRVSFSSLDDAAELRSLGASLAGTPDAATGSGLGRRLVR